MSTLLLALLSVGLSVAAQFLLKLGISSAEIQSVLAQPLGVRVAASVFSNVKVLGGLTLYGLGAVVWLGVLSHWDVSKAYPLVGLGFVLTVAIGWLIGEQVTLLRSLGVALICIGAALVGRS